MGISQKSPEDCCKETNRGVGVEHQSGKKGLVGVPLLSKQALREQHHIWLSWASFNISKADNGEIQINTVNSSCVVLINRCRWGGRLETLDFPENLNWAKVTSQGKRQSLGSHIQEGNMCSHLSKPHCCSYFLLNIFSLVALTDSWSTVRVTHPRCRAGSKLLSWMGPLCLLWTLWDPSGCSNLLGTY